MVDRVVEILEKNPSGVALLGNEGVGKTTLAGQAAVRLGRGEPIWVVGTAAQSSVPFGAFGPAIDARDIGKPAAMIAHAAESILAQANSAPIIVDNARLLDPLSSSLLYRLAQQDASPVIVTVRSVLRAPQVVTALWNDGMLERVDVIGFDAAENAAVVAAAGGTDAAMLYRRSAGNPLHLRLLMTTGGSDETLAAAVDRYLAELAAPVREALGHLCVFEPLSWADLVVLTSEAIVAAAEECGAVQTRGADVYSGHPLFLERLATILDKAAVQRLRAAVAAQLSTGTDRTPADHLGRTLLALQGDGPIDGDEVVASAQEALRLGDLGLAERLARGVVDRGHGSEEQLMAWALPRAANQFWMLSEPERAAVFLQTVRERVGTASSRITLDALSATFAMNAGNVRRAVEVAGEVLDRPDAPDMAVAWASSAAALSSARMGRLGDVAALVDRVLGAEYPGLLRFTVGLAETTTALMNADTDGAYQIARKFTDFAELAQPGRAIGEVLLAEVLLARGEAAAAADLLGPAAATLDRTGYSWGSLALMYLTTALAHQGEIAESAMALSRAQSRHGTKSALFAPELGIARAWRLATIGDRPAAITAARGAARMAQRGGQFAVAVRAWHESARLGDRRAAAGLEQIADQVQCAYTSMALAHARAVTTDDAAGLASAAERWAAAGFHGAARDAAEQAGSAARLG
ncbi:MAG: AAA family ATPase [Mycobacterium sp.]|nr:AAA family ATPase [Mycobacterium sp.]